MAEPIIEKLRKLFALAAEDSGATEAERNNAAAQAAKLMAKYDIDRAEVGEDSGSAHGTIGAVPWRTIKRNDIWQQLLATSISVGLGNPVEVLGRVGGAGREVYMIGDPVKVEFVQRLADYLIPQLEIECEAALLARKESYAQAPRIDGLTVVPWKAGDTKRFRQAFLKTAAQALRGRIEDAYREETESVGGTDLILRSDRDRVNDFMDDNDIRVRQSKTRVSSFAGAAAGNEASRRVDIQPGSKLGGGGRHRLGAGA